MSIVVSQTEFIKTEIYIFYIFKRKLIAADCEGVKFFLSEDHLLQLKLMWIFYKMIELIRVFLHFRPIVPIKLPKLIKGNVNPLLLPPSKFISLKNFVTECTDLSQIHSNVENALIFFLTLQLKGINLFNLISVWIAR